MKYRTNCKMYDEVYMGNPGAVPWCKIHGLEPDCENCTRPSKTNADRIRSMSDEELAALCESGCPPRRGCPDLTKEDVDKSYHELCQKCWLDWLKEEVNE